MAEQSYFMGQDGFVWFVGVVEDRNDPELLGRVRVRALGFHTEVLEDLPTTDLPWAHVMHPVTDPSMQGMGNTPAFLVEGSWVIGFFRDLERQQPVILGSLPGTPELPADHRFGFNDPRSPYSNQDEYAGMASYGPYPVDGYEYEVPSGHNLKEPDTNRLAQGQTSETHNSLMERRLSRLRGDPTILDTTVGVDDTGTYPNTTQFGTGVPIATQPYLKSVSDVAVEENRLFWEEPNPKSTKKYVNPYKSSQYPYNHVFESESGHITEVDDSPGAERLFRQHTSGTFEEIHPDGSKVVKIVGDNYEIIAGKSNVSITGDVNLTVTGNVRELIKGDYHLEVEGDYTQKIHKNHRVKIGAGESGGNREEEILGNHSFNIKQNVKGRIGEKVNVTTEGDEVRLNNGNYKQGIKLNMSLMAGTKEGNMTLNTTGNMSISTTSGIVSVKSGSTLNMKSATLMTIASETTIDMDATTEVDVDAATINLN
tara:strand:- start:445 stop:1890 length:1446 start_codon:yes stop_codon:yes gene_type:complete